MDRWKDVGRKEWNHEGWKQAREGRSMNEGNKK